MMLPLLAVLLAAAVGAAAQPASNAGMAPTRAVTNGKVHFWQKTQGEPKGTMVRAAACRGAAAVAPPLLPLPPAEAAAGRPAVLQPILAAVLGCAVCGQCRSEKSSTQRHGRERWGAAAKPRSLLLPPRLPFRCSSTAAAPAPRPSSPLTPSLAPSARVGRAGAAEALVARCLVLGIAALPPLHAELAPPCISNLQHDLGSDPCHAMPCPHSISHHLSWAGFPEYLAQTKQALSRGYHVLALQVRWYCSYRSRCLLCTAGAGLFGYHVLALQVNCVFWDQQVEIQLPLRSGGGLRTCTARSIAGRLLDTSPLHALVPLPYVPMGIACQAAALFLCKRRPATRAAAAGAPPPTTATRTTGSWCGSVTCVSVVIQPF